MDEGVIKFNCTWLKDQALRVEGLAELIQWRDRICAAGLIGVYANGVGYGNISLRLAERAFLISGTQTGQLQQTGADHYTLVDDWNIPQNTLRCRGPVKASSESLTHAALYTYSPSIRAIVHGHHPQLWQHYQHVLPTTRASVPYGTPAMASEMWRLLRDDTLLEQKVLVMAGHEDGLLAFGGSLAVAAESLLSLLQQP